eukprot:CAMPEP_0174384150 /NCGR_PEP_ID=MMETSP0811_2-20130205/125722_1 /TAXON_ID=73025 ORGANISM="Eutreptiella gymnastica-like, Strain CCMP1594" /NCGR_SAMPLE_ID=MMETSP0811_2 /ASSEMBLY_ACC=CAM_ASM_000667 /LENGTH=40 /DNA_ID= /DNA_START= /DNA_END= /DNA_ORIENTATION=
MKTGRPHSAAMCHGSPEDVDGCEMGNNLGLTVLALERNDI